jgi:hypothetical protein
MAQDLSIGREEQQTSKQAEDVSMPPNQPNATNAETIRIEAINTKQEELEERIKRGEKWMIWLTATIAFFALCSVIVGTLQWRVMSGQLDEMKSSSADAKKLTQAAVNQAAAAQTTIQVIQENMRLEQRAWVGVKAIRITPPPWKAEQKLEATVIVENTGRTPALEVKVIKRYGPRPPSKTELSKPVAEPINVFAIAPTNSYESTVTLSEKLSEPDLRLLASGKRYYVYGTITYKDIFSTMIRETLFWGYYIDGFRGLQFCPTFNDMK